jgi:hypothetical protein
VNERRRLWCEDRTTLNWAVMFFVIALIAVLRRAAGFGGGHRDVGERWLDARRAGVVGSPSGVLGRAIGGGGRNARP